MDRENPNDEQPPPTNGCQQQRGKQQRVRRPEYREGERLERESQADPRARVVTRGHGERSTYGPPVTKRCDVLPTGVTCHNAFGKIAHQTPPGAVRRHETTALWRGHRE